MSTRPLPDPFKATQKNAFQMTPVFLEESFYILTGTHTSQQETFGFWLQLDNILGCDHRPQYYRLPPNSIMSAGKRMCKCRSLFFTKVYAQLPYILKYFTPHSIKIPQFFFFILLYLPPDFLQDVFRVVDCGSEEF